MITMANLPRAPAPGENRTGIAVATTLPVKSIIFRICIHCTLFKFSRCEKKRRDNTGAETGFCKEEGLANC